jgi:hypothetical protein
MGKNYSVHLSPEHYRQRQSYTLHYFNLVYILISLERAYFSLRHFTENLIIYSQK